jgi:glycosyltransferase involved in cell wall biosynthesis
MKIIVLTPVRNEEWILDQFLQTCSMFADHIIIADQNSTDRSVEIASKYEKVIIIHNDNLNFNEAERQILLIEKARELFGLGNFLLALDADEIIAADSINAKGWNTIKEASLSTVFLFDKPTPLFNLSKALRYKKGFPLGFKDDGSAHTPTLIHSVRIPTPKHANYIMLHDIVFLHLCFVRSNVQFSKNRYYCVLENINKVRRIRSRRLLYSFYKPNDYAKGNMLAINPLWYKAYNEKQILLRDFKEDSYFYMDFEVLKIFNQYGEEKFYNDPIWKFDWEACRLEALKLKIAGIPNKKIKRPLFLQIFVVDLIFDVMNKITAFKKKIT